MGARRDKSDFLIVPDEENAPLTAEEIRLQKRLFSNTSSLPEGYRTWLPDFAVLNAPQIPYSSISGVRAGLWRDWTPVWTSASNPQPSKGNGTLVGRYAINGQVVVAVLNLTAGSSTSFGTGNWTFSLPTEIAPAFFYLGSGRAFDNDVAGRYAVSATVDATSLIASFDATAGPGSRLAPTVPFTWAQNDNLYLSVTYEILR